MAASLSSLHTAVARPAAFRFVPQADRRQLADRRTTWRGGRRVSDFARVAEAAPLNSATPDAHAIRRTIMTAFCAERREAADAGTEFRAARALQRTAR